LLKNKTLEKERNQMQENPQKNVNSPKGNVYEIGKLIAENTYFRLFSCKQRGTNKQCLLQIASERKHNGVMDRIALLLGEIRRQSDEIEIEYAKVKNDPKDQLNYYLGFTELVENFISTEQGNRTINILAFHNVEIVNNMVPIHYIIHKDQLRVDLRTSNWIMGKSLKLLVFLHSLDISINNLGIDNILIEPDQHYVVFFELSNAKMYNEELPKEQRREEISQLAQTIIHLIGGDHEKRSFPDDARRKFKEYTDFLLRLANGSHTDAETAQNEFYEIVDSLWKKEFYHFTCHSL
jgi:hypothetical protein